MNIIKRNFLIIIVLLYSNGLFAQSDSVFKKEIIAGDYKVFLTNNESEYFTGSIKVVDIDNNTVFSADSFYSGYSWDTLIDLDKNGTEELILDFTTGALIYDYNMILIFDLSKDHKSIIPFEIHNADLDTKTDDRPKIVSNVRLSPSVLGAGYTYSLKYENGKPVLEDDMEKSKVLKSFDSDEIEEQYMISDYKKELDECAEDSNILVYYEACLMQQKILGQEERGWEFFDSSYNCKDKTKVRAELKNLVNENYGNLKNSDFRFNEE